MSNQPSCDWLTTCVLAASALAAPTPASGSQSPDCASLEQLQLPDVTVLEVTAADTPVAHCRLDGRISQSIHFSVWLPTAWNGGFVMGGQGGFAGQVSNQALQFAPVLQGGYASAATDTGHQGRSLDGSWALGDLEAIVNYGHVAVHRVTEVAKATIAAHYTKAPETSFFIGCSNGGRQALQEAQRYPDDFDVILAGAPALDFDGLGAAFLHITQRMHADMDHANTPLLTMDDRRLLRSAIEERCDANDGIVDGVLAHPPACDFDPRTLSCGEGQLEGCLSDRKLDVIESIYGGPQTVGGESLHVGFPFGAEDTEANGWGTWLTGRANGGGPGVPSAAFGFGVGLAKYFVYQNEDWSYEGYDFESWNADARAVARTLDASNPNLDAFRERGGKLLMFHGWSDVALSAHMSIDYAESVYERDASAHDDLRLFMMPGVLHCVGGEGPSVVDWLQVMETWRDRGEAPLELEVRWPDDDGAQKICAWPQQAVYTGDDPRDPTSFTCR